MSVERRCALKSCGRRFVARNRRGRPQRFCKRAHKDAAWRKANPERAREHSRRSSARGLLMRRTTFGRICASCGEPDSAIAWGSSSVDYPYCVNCQKRGGNNGFCGHCSVAKFADGSCDCPAPEKRTKKRALNFLVGLQEMLRLHEGECMAEVDVAPCFGYSERNMVRVREKIIATARQFDPSFHYESVFLGESRVAGCYVFRRFVLARKLAPAVDEAIAG